MAFLPHTGATVKKKSTIEIKQAHSREMKLPTHPVT
jgi:hypothetical protein